MMPINKFEIMKRLLLIFILTVNFQILSKADDLSDFEIEGVSLGDSLLDHYDRDNIGLEMSSTRPYWYENNKFIAMGLFEIEKSHKIFDGIGVVIKPNDNNFYKIYSIYGKLYFENKPIKDCYTKQKNISKEITDIYSNTIIDKDEWTVQPERLRDHLVSQNYIDLILKEGKIRVVCYERKSGNHLLQVVLNGKEFQDFLTNSANE
jgi:hypothetical protein